LKGIWCWKEFGVERNLV